MSYSPPQSKDELLARYAHGERYFAEIELPDGTDLQGVDLSEAVFDRAFLSDIDFRHANLAHTTFRHANVKCSDFRSANLRGAIFDEALVESIWLDPAHADDVSIAGASWYGVTLSQADIATLIASRA